MKSGSIPVRTLPITDGDCKRVAVFLSEQMPAPLSADDWRSAIGGPWTVYAPNYGYLLERGGEIVGACLAYYSERELAGERLRLCNLGTWCVVPELRMHSLRLLLALTNQEGYAFTDLSPSENVVSINERLGFERLTGTRATVVPALPWPSGHERIEVTSDPARISELLEGEEARLMNEHSGARGVSNLVLARGQERCYVAFRRQWRKGLPVATFLHVSDPSLLRDGFRSVCRHLLLCFRAALAVIDERLLPDCPGPRLRYGRGRVKMYRGPRAIDKAVDYLYSELACMPPERPQRRRA